MNLKDRVYEKNETENTGKHNSLLKSNAEYEQIESLLMENQKLLIENAKLKNVITDIKAETTRMITIAKEDYRNKEIDLEKRLAQAENIKNQALKMQKQYDRILTQKAKNLTEKNRVAYQREYRQKMNAVYGITMTALLYSIFVTLLTGINSVRFSRDFENALLYAFTILKIPFDIAVKMSKTVYKIKQMIQYVNINIIIAGLLTVFTFVATVAIGYGLIY